MKVLVVTLQTDGDVYVQGVYRGCTEEQVKEVLLTEMDSIDGYDFHEETTSTTPRA